LQVLQYITFVDEPLGTFVAKVVEEEGALADPAEVHGSGFPVGAGLGSFLTGLLSRTFWMAFLKASKFLRFALNGRTRLSVP